MTVCPYTALSFYRVSCIAAFHLVVGPDFLIPSLLGGDEPLLPAPDRRL